MSECETAWRLSNSSFLYPKAGMLSTKSSWEEDAEEKQKTLPALLLLGDLSPTVFA